MDLGQYLKRFTPAGRADFALSVGTTVGHLNNVAYGMRLPSASLARQIHDFTSGQVPVWTLRPGDWQAIWPEMGGPDRERPTPVSELGNAEQQGERHAA